MENLIATVTGQIYQQTKKQNYQVETFDSATFRTGAYIASKVFTKLFGSWNMYYTW